MNRKGGQIGADQRTTLPEPDQNNATAVERVFYNNAEELIWVAEVMAGSSQVGEECLAEAIDLAETAKHVSQEWMLSWVRRLLVHVALKRISVEILDLLPPAGPQSAVKLAGVRPSTRDRQKLRSIPPQRIIALLSVLERACFILYAYLEYPMVDCALLLGCPTCWIESICERVLTKIVSLGQFSEDDCRDVDFIDSPGVTECAG